MGANGDAGLLIGRLQPRMLGRLAPPAESRRVPARPPLPGRARRTRTATPATAGRQRLQHLHIDRLQAHRGHCRYRSTLFLTSTGTRCPATKGPESMTIRKKSPRADRGRGGRGACADRLQRHRRRAAAESSGRGGGRHRSTASGGGAVADTPNFTIAMITHETPGDTFWDKIRAGAQVAAAKDNIDLKYSNDPIGGRAGHPDPERGRQQGGRHRDHPGDAGRDDGCGEAAHRRRHPGGRLQLRHRRSTRTSAR